RSRCPRRRATALTGTPAIRDRGASPLGLRSLDDVVDDFLQGLASAFRLGSLVVVALAAHPLPLEQHAPVRLFDDLDIDGDEQASPRRDGLIRNRAHRNR